MDPAIDFFFFFKTSVGVTLGHCTTFFSFLMCFRYAIANRFSHLHAVKKKSLVLPEWPSDVLIKPLLKASEQEFIQFGCIWFYFWSVSGDTTPGKENEMHHDIQVVDNSSTQACHTCISPLQWFATKNTNIQYNIV